MLRKPQLNQRAARWAKTVSLAEGDGELPYSVGWQWLQRSPAAPHRGRLPGMPLLPTPIPATALAMLIGLLVFFGGWRFWPRKKEKKITFSPSAGSPTEGAPADKPASEPAAAGELAAESPAEEALFDRVGVGGGGRDFINANTGMKHAKQTSEAKADLTKQYGRGNTTITFSSSSDSSRTAVELGVDSFIACGSFGAVWKVTDLKGKKSYALKIGMDNIFSKEDMAEAGTTNHTKSERILREFQLAQKISDEIRSAAAATDADASAAKGWYNVMETYRLGQDPGFRGHPVILMQLAESADLFSYLAADNHQNFPLPAERAAGNTDKFNSEREQVLRHIFAQFADGLAFLQDSCDVIHRDLKCDQLLLQPDGGSAYRRLHSGAGVPPIASDAVRKTLELRLLISDFGEGKDVGESAGSGCAATNARTRMLIRENKTDAAGKIVSTKLVSSKHGGFANMSFRAPEAVHSTKGKTYDGKSADCWAMGANMLFVAVLDAS
eukprot:SAG22_NODE_291_length_12933_cov_5.599657_7_plen_497_part_00